MKSQGKEHKKNPMPAVGRKKVFVGVSGGVDSSVSLALLKEATPNNFEKLFGRPTPKGFRGYDVTGVFLKVWHPDFLPCDWKEERRSAMRVCATLGVPFITLDCEAEYKKEVVDYMIREYSAGRVPNPDVFCNKYVKFGVFLEKALAMGADFVATGHYSISALRKSCLQEHLGEAKNVLQATDTNIYELLESTDKNKDQSYFLYTLNQHQLSHTLFPVGHMTKPEVRKLAEKFGLPTATKKDSQGLCFIGKVDMKEFLKHFIHTERGDVLNVVGEIIGYHDGALLYAIGERHGFTITKKSPNDPRFFVVSKDMEKNTITVASSKNQESSKESGIKYSAKKIIIKDLHFVSGENISSLACSVRIRYRQEKQKCIVEKTVDGYEISFDVPQTGVSVGQSAVLYDGEVCLGGGIIEEVIH